MKAVGVVLCLVLAVSACGGGREKHRDSNDLRGIRGYLKDAFSREGDVSGGGLCGDPLLVGERIGTVDGNGACGIEDAVQLRAIGNVTLSQPATLNCKTARTLRGWLENGAKPAIGKRGGGIGELRVAAHYVCRTRNHQAGAKVSEHGKGNAIDISALRLRDGTEITVLNDWGKGKNGKALKAMHKSACGPFGTVLGPGSDGFHQDHLHFDTAVHGNGSYCR